MGPSTDLGHCSPAASAQLLSIRWWIALVLPAGAALWPREVLLPYPAPKALATSSASECDHHGANSFFVDYCTRWFHQRSPAWRCGQSSSKVFQLDFGFSSHASRSPNNVPSVSGCLSGRCRATSRLWRESGDGQDGLFHETKGRGVSVGVGRSRVAQFGGSFGSSRGSSGNASAFG